MLTLHYDGGKKYELEETIAPGDQMWVNLAQLVRQRVPDRKGNLLPVDVSSVTVDVKGLPPTNSNLMVNELALNRTYGPSGASPFCFSCCEGVDPGSPIFLPESLVLDVGAIETLSIDGDNSCTGQPEDISSYFSVWGSDDPPPWR